MYFRLFLRRMSALIACVIAITGLSQYTASISAAAIATAIPEFISISAGNSFAIALAKDGSVWSWGENAAGQLADNTRTNRSAPQKIKELSGVVKIVCGEFHAIALKKDGTVWTWGNNDLGQLGNSGIERNAKLPRMVKGLKDIVAIAGGSKHSFALTKDGTVWGWGKNYEGQLSLKDTKYTNRPTIISNLPKMSYITSKYEYSIGISTDDKVYIWGDYNATTRSRPIELNTVTKVKEVCTLRSEAIFLLKDGTVWRLQNTTGNYEQLKDLTDIRQISGGSSHFIALKNDNTVWTWGTLFSSSDIVVVRNGNIDAKVQKIDSLSDIVFVSSGSNSDYCIDSKNRVYSWGNNSFGQLGLPTVLQMNSPTKIDHLSGIKYISTNESYSIALKDDGSVWEWGKTRDIFDTSNKGIPVKKDGMPEANSISCTGTNAAIVSTDGKVYTWGSNINDGTRPLSISFTGISLKEVSGYSLDTFTLLSTDGIVISFAASRGQDGLFVNTSLPKIKHVSSRYKQHLALTEDGMVWQWEFPNTGTSQGGNMAKKIASLFDVISVSAGNGFSVALKNDGTVWTWGSNTKGQLGDGSLNRSDVPVKVKDLSDVSRIFAGSNHCIAVKKDGTVWAWGDNTYGQLGDGTTENNSVPVQAKTLKNITTAAAGNGHSLAVDKSGNVYSWGLNDNGQLGLGIGTFVQKPTVLTIK